MQVRCPKPKGTNKVGKYRFIHVNINITCFSSHINSTCMSVGVDNFKLIMLFFEELRVSHGNNNIILRELVRLC